MHGLQSSRHIPVSAWGLLVGHWVSLVSVKRTRCLVETATIIAKSNKVHLVIGTLLQVVQSIRVNLLITQPDPWAGQGAGAFVFYEQRRDARG